MMDSHAAPAAARRTEVSIHGTQFWINGQPTYAGRVWEGKSIEGTLFNSRMVQGIFDDLNPETRDNWIYPDTKVWDADRNTDEFIVAMAEWRRHGLLAFTINLQGGSPYGYSSKQPWINSAFTPEGELRPEYMGRVKRILDRADELGMVAIVGLFYFGQDDRFNDEAAVVRAVDNSLDWLFEQGYRNVLIEVNNECDIRYHHPILLADRVHELVQRVARTSRDGRRFLVSTSYSGGKMPRANVLENVDFVLLHGNGVADPKRIARMVEETRKMESYRPMPIVFNEDDHFDFEKPENNFLAAVRSGASWGYFDYRKKGEEFEEGYQSVPVNWGISSPRKRGFFELVGRITGKK